MAAGARDEVIALAERLALLARLTSLLYRRAPNIRALRVGAEGDDGLVSIEIRVAGQAGETERLARSVRSLVDVRSAEVEALTPGREAG